MQNIFVLTWETFRQNLVYSVSWLNYVSYRHNTNIFNLKFITQLTQCACRPHDKVHKRKIKKKKKKTTWPWSLDVMSMAR